MAEQTPPPLYNGPTAQQMFGFRGSVPGGGPGAGFGGASYGSGTRGLALLRLIRTRYGGTQPTPAMGARLPGPNTNENPNTPPTPIGGVIGGSDPGTYPTLPPGAGGGYRPPYTPGGEPKPLQPPYTPEGPPSPKDFPKDPTKPGDPGYFDPNPKSPNWNKPYNFMNIYGGSHGHPELYGDLGVYPGLVPDLVRKKDWLEMTPTERQRMLGAGPADLLRLSNTGLAYMGRSVSPNRQVPTLGFSDAELSSQMLPSKRLLAARFGL